MNDGRFGDLFKLRWPRKGDSPFIRSAIPRDNANVALPAHERLTMMIAGYKLAADLMVERTKRDSYDRDALVYPVLFNYRQFIELSLKSLIATYGPTVGIPPNWKSHSLSTLWISFINVLGKYKVEDPTGANPVVANVVAQFARVDPDSFSNRYPVDTSGNPIPIAHDQLDLTVLADVMQALDMYFSGCDGYLDDLQSAGQ